MTIPFLSTLRSLNPNSRRNLICLFLLQALPGGQTPILFAFSGLNGYILAEDKAFATLPISLIVIGTMLSSLPISLLMGRYGRRAGLLVGLAFGAVGGALGLLSVVQAEFIWLLIGSFCSGVCFASLVLIRFAAVDAVPPPLAPKAISWVLIGGLFAAVIGIEIVTRSESSLMFIPFAGVYLTVIGLNVVGMLIALGVKIPPPVIKKAARGHLFLPGRRPSAIIAVLCAMIFYAMMNLIMTSAPLAMHHHGFDNAIIADVVRWHVIFMFAPSLFTGNLITRFGTHRVIGAGLVLMIAAQIAGLSGVSMFYFYLTMILLGLGWNFGFVGATALLATTHRPEGQSRVQGVNDLCIFSLVAIASLSSGVLMHHFNWFFVNMALLPLQITIAGALLYLYLHQRRTITPPATANPVIQS